MNVNNIIYISKQSLTTAANKSNLMDAICY